MNEHSTNNKQSSFIFYRDQATEDWFTQYGSSLGNAEVEYVYNEDTGEYDEVQKALTTLKFDVLSDIFVEIIPSLELFNFTSPETPSTEKFKEALEDFDFLSFFGGDKRKKRDVQAPDSFPVKDEKSSSVLDLEGEELMRDKRETAVSDNLDDDETEEGSGGLMRPTREEQNTEMPLEGGGGGDTSTLDPLLEAQNFYSTLYSDIDRFVTTLARVFRNTTNARWKRSHEGADSCSFLYALPRYIGIVINSKLN